MDPALIAATAVFFGLVAIALWINNLCSRKARPQKPQVGYQRAEIIVDPRAVPEFKPTWRSMRGKSEAS